MGFFDEPVRADAAGARAVILHLLRNHNPTRGASTELVELADRYLRLNPGDTAVKRSRDRLATHGA